jgi:hypothetical protein
MHAVKGDRHPALRRVIVLASLALGASDYESAAQRPPRWTIALPLTVAVTFAVGGLMYAGSYGVGCDGTRYAPAVAHPTLPWPLYVLLGAASVVMALLPLTRRVELAPSRSITRAADGDREAHRLDAAG